MRFTFGIITGGDNNPREIISKKEISSRIDLIIDSIYKNNIPEFEIIVIGGEGLSFKKILDYTTYLILNSIKILYQSRKI